ncbi:hypothetical protein MMC10_004406 [Thelotrema lepadinum]|nr:hypothetical protein [Thelotrema lepadinum]
MANVFAARESQPITYGWPKVSDDKAEFWLQLMNKIYPKSLFTEIHLWKALESEKQKDAQYFKDLETFLRISVDVKRLASIPNPRRAQGRDLDALPLGYAWACESPRLMELLLRHGANPNAKTTIGHTVLEAIYVNKHEDSRVYVPFDATKAKPEQRQMLDLLKRYGAVYLTSKVKSAIADYERKSPKSTANKNLSQLLQGQIPSRSSRARWFPWRQPSPSSNAYTSS